MQAFLLALTLALPVGALAANRVEYDLGPHASPVLTRLLAESGWSEVTATGYAPGERIAQADCRVHAFRSWDPPSIDPSNRVVCTYRQGTASRELTLSLANVPVLAWGTDRTTLPVKIKGPLVGKLTDLLRNELDTDERHPLVSGAEGTYVDGSYLSGSYALHRFPIVYPRNRPPESTMAAVSCYYDYLSGTLVDRTCVFLSATGH